MDFISVLAVSVSLAVDAFAVAVAAGVSPFGEGRRRGFRLAFHFGLFQAGMPVLGWLSAAYLLGFIEGWDHWAAFALLSFVGGKMALGSLRGGEGAGFRSDPTRGFSLAALSVATSIDAFAVGISLGLVRAGIIVPCATIGIVTAMLTWTGFAFGRRIGGRFGKNAELAGGIVLIALGARILIEHLL